MTTTCYPEVGIRKLTLEEPSSAEVIASNDDLLTELLLRLPIKSLLKFKSVCKQWLSLVTDPHFTRRKHLNSNTVSALYVDVWSFENGYKFLPLRSHPWQTRSTCDVVDLTLADSPHGIRIEQSCNGLLCCRSIGEENKYFVYNPTTNQFKTLPPFKAYSSCLKVSLAFDPSKSHFYKVVCIQGGITSHNVCQILIYSSETERWRVSRSPFTARRSIQNWGREAYWNGAIYWFTWFTVMDTSVLYFDLNEELVREIPIPPPMPGSLGRGVPFLEESGGHLHLVEYSRDLTSKFNVYEMERDRSGWFVKFQVDIDVLAQPCGWIFPTRVLSVIRGEKEEDSFMVLCLPTNKIIQYNFSRQNHEEICHPNSRIPEIWGSTFQYIESLSIV